MAKIEPIPPLPFPIRESAENGNLAIFVGAGASMLYGCDSWRQLANRMVNCCFGKEKSDIPLITFKEKEHLLKEGNPKKVLTICRNILNKNAKQELYISELKDALSAKPTPLPNDNLFDHLYKMGLGGGLYLTTNADDLFSSKFNDRLIFHPKKFNRHNIDKSSLYHLHGSIKDVSSLVFTVPEYLRRYGEESLYLSFLKEVFDKFTILFVGYGLEELEILEFLVAKLRRKTDTLEEAPTRFVLIGLYKGEENILQNEQEYFDTLGIRVIAYQKDIRGYHQLENVISAWSDQINQVSRVLPNNFDEIKEICDKGEIQNIGRIDHLILNDESRTNHLWKCLSETPLPEAWLKILYERNEFAPNKSPVPIELKEENGGYTIPYWRVLGYLENVSKKNEQNPNTFTTRILKVIIKENFKHIKTLGDKNRNDRTEWIFTKIIFNLPLGNITSTHIDYIKYFLTNQWGNTLISSDLGRLGCKKILSQNNIQVSAKLFETILAFKTKKTSFGTDIDSLLDNYWFKELIEKNLSDFINALGTRGLDILIRQIKKIGKVNKYSFSVTWIPSVDGSKCDHLDKYETQIVFAARDFLNSINDKAEVLKVGKSFFKSNENILQRLAFHLFRTQYGILKKEVWEILNKNPLQNHEAKYEIYMFLKENSTAFLKKDLQVILSWIEKIKISHEKDAEKKVLYEAFIKKEWLSALIECGDKRVLQRYSRYEKINSTPLEHPGFASWSECGFVSNVSPYTIDELKKLEIQKQIALISSFNGKNEAFRNEPSKEGLGETLEAIALEDPFSVIGYLENYLKLEPLYIYYILRGLDKAKLSSTSILLDFVTMMDLYIRNISDWSFTNEPGERFSYDESIVGETCSIICKNLGDGTGFFTSDLSNKISRLLTYIWGNLTLKTQADSNDVVTLVLNTNQGKLYESFLLFMLWKARNTTSSGPVKWDKEHKELFENCLRSENRTREFSATLGKFIRNFLYLDSEWVLGNFENIFPLGNDTAWKDTMTALLFYMNNVYDDIFSRLKNAGHYSKALKTTFYSNDISKRVIDHIVVAYLYKIEEMEEGSLICEVLKSDNIFNLKHLVSFLSYRDIEKDDDRKKRILDLWKKLYELFANKNDDESKKIRVSLARIQKHFDSLDVNFDNLKTSYQSLAFSDFSFDILEILAKQVDEEAQYVSSLLLETINAEYFFSYKEDVLVTLINKIYSAGEKESADRICIAYLARGIGYLQPVYEKYNPT